MLAAHTIRTQFTTQFAHNLRTICAQFFPLWQRVSGMFAHNSDTIPTQFRHNSRHFFIIIITKNKKLTFRRFFVLKNNRGFCGGGLPWRAVSGVAVAGGSGGRCVQRFGRVCRRSVSGVVRVRHLGASGGRWRSVSAAVRAGLQRQRVRQRVGRVMAARQPSCGRQSGG